MGEFAAALQVSRGRTPEFWNPIGAIRSRQARVAAVWIGMLMPETSLNLHDRVVLRKHDVGTAGKSVTVERVPKPLRMKIFADRHLRLCVLGGYSLHVSGTGEPGHAVSHGSIATVSAVLRRPGASHVPRIRGVSTEPLSRHSWASMKARLPARQGGTPEIG